MKKTDTPFIYDKKKFLEEYKLISLDEYGLLPYEVRMAYCAERFEYQVREAQEKSTSNGIGYIHPYYKEYFDANGCTYENYDFGIEEYSLKKVSDKKYEVSSEAKEKLNYYRSVVGLVKFETFERKYKQFYLDKIKKIEAGEAVELDNFDALNILKSIRNNSVSQWEAMLSREELEAILKAELTFVLEAIHNGENDEIAEDAPVIYKDFVQNYKANVSIGTQKGVQKVNTMQ